MPYSKCKLLRLEGFCSVSTDFSIFLFAKPSRPKCQKFNELLLSRWSQSAGQRKNRKAELPKMWSPQAFPGTCLRWCRSLAHKIWQPLRNVQNEWLGWNVWGDLPVIPLSKLAIPSGWANFNIIGNDMKLQMKLQVCQTRLMWQKIVSYSLN